MGIMRLEPTKKKVQTEAEMFSVTETKCIKYELCNCDFFRTFIYICMYVCIYICIIRTHQHQHYWKTER